MRVHRSVVENWRSWRAVAHPCRRTLVKSIAGQTDDEMGGAWSVLVRQRRDHVRLDGLLDEVLATSGWDQDTALRRLARLVFPHAFAEESVLWPPDSALLAGRPRLDAACG